MWALVSPDGVAPSCMVSVSASVNLPLHHNVQKFSSGTGSEKGGKTVVCVRARVCVLVLSVLQCVHVLTSCSPKSVKMWS